MDTRTLFQKISQRMRADFEASSQIRHSGSKGTVRENALRNFLAEGRFPAKYGLGILRDPRGFLENVGRYLVAIRDDYFWTLQSTKGDNLSFDGYREKYDPSKIRDMASGEELKFIADHVDPAVMDAFGYRIDV